jgi:hypothetical protein
MLHDGVTQHELLPAPRLQNEANMRNSTYLAVQRGRVAAMNKDAFLPASPRGFRWRPLAERSIAELRESAKNYSLMAETARMLEVAANLRNLAAEFDEIADQRECIA